MTNLGSVVMVLVAIVAFCVGYTVGQTNHWPWSTHSATISIK